MKTNNTFIIAREGWKMIGITAIVWLVAMLLDLDLLAFISFVAVAGLLFIFRNPERELPYFQENSILALCDGRVKSIETVETSPFMEGPCFKIVISKGYSDVAVLRSPFDGTVKSFHHQSGSQLCSDTKLATLLNEQASILFETRNNKLGVEHLSALSIEQLHLYPVVGQSTKQGARYGLMLSGEHTIYLPENSRVAVKVDEELIAGETLLGYFS